MKQIFQRKISGSPTRFTYNSLLKRIFLNSTRFKTRCFKSLMFLLSPQKLLWILEILLCYIHLLKKGLAYISKERYFLSKLVTISSDIFYGDDPDGSTKDLSHWKTSACKKCFFSLHTHTHQPVGTLLLKVLIECIKFV